MAIRALIIDDQPTNILVLEQLLRIEGVEVVSLQGIQSAEQLETYLSDLLDIRIVFLDLEMPKYNGFDIYKLIRELPNFRDCKIVAYSVHSNELDNVVDSGFDGFIGKPIDADAFPQQLSDILAGIPVSYIP